MYNYRANRGPHTQDPPRVFKHSLSLLLQQPPGQKLTSYTHIWCWLLLSSTSIPLNSAHTISWKQAVSLRRSSPTNHECIKIQKQARNYFYVDIKVNVCVLSGDVVPTPCSRVRRVLLTECTVLERTIIRNHKRARGRFACN